MVCVCSVACSRCAVGKGWCTRTCDSVGQNKLILKENKCHTNLVQLFTVQNSFSNHPVGFASFGGDMRQLVSKLCPKTQFDFVAWRSFGLSASMTHALSELLVNLVGVKKRFCESSTFDAFALFWPGTIVGSQSGSESSCRDECGHWGARSVRDDDSGSCTQDWRSRRRRRYLTSSDRA